MSVDLELALRTAINVLRDAAESKRLPNGLQLTVEKAEIHWRSAAVLENTLNGRAKVPRKP